MPRRWNWIKQWLVNTRYSESWRVWAKASVTMKSIIAVKEFLIFSNCLITLAWKAWEKIPVSHCILLLWEVKRNIDTENLWYLYEGSRSFVRFHADGFFIGKFLQCGLALIKRTLHHTKTIYHLVAQLPIFFEVSGEFKS